MKKTLVMIMVSFIITFHYSCIQAVNIESAQNYTVIEKRNTSFPSRKRIGWYITSNAKDKTERAHTVIKAAQDLHNTTRCDLCSIYLEISKPLAGRGITYAIADYAPDRKGISGEDNWTWKVSASNKKYPKKTELQIIEDFYKFEKQFEEPFIFKGKNLGMEVNEKKLQKFLAQKHNVKNDTIDKILTNNLFVAKEKYLPQKN